MYDDLLRGFGVVDSFQARRCFQELVHQYTQGHRYYHTLWHVEKVVEEVKYICSMQNTNWQEERGLILAALYHDIVYDTSPNRPVANEVESANMFMAHARLLEIEDERLLVRVYELIASTIYADGRSHNILGDADLAGLGSPWSNYSKNGELIRKEFGATMEQWKAGRGKFLECFMHDEPIFFTEEFQEFYERQACENLLRDYNNCRQ